MTNVSLDRIANALGMTESKTPDTHIWATVSSINDDGSYQVQMNGAGASETTRAARLCNASVGDRVLCVVSNGQVSAIGRAGGEQHDWIKPWTLIAETTGTATASFASIEDYKEILVIADYQNPYPSNVASFEISVPISFLYGQNYNSLFAGNESWKVSVSVSTTSMFLDNATSAGGNWASYFKNKLYAR